MENKDSMPGVKMGASGVYQGPDLNYITLWKQLTVEQRNQYIEMTVDMLLADPDYKPTPRQLVLSRDQWIEALQASAKLMLKIKT